MDEHAGGGLLRFAQAVDAESKQTYSLLYKMADSIAELQATVKRLDAEMAELRDEILKVAERG
jgi:hypothetical protein